MSTSSKHSRRTTFLIGTSGWSYPDWQQAFYPKDWPKQRWLEYYATQFRTVEINATFYRFFKKQTFIKWRETVPKAFRFVVKVPRLITHRKNLVNCKKLIKDFCQAAAYLENKLGLILLQLAPHLHYNLNRLEEALLAFDEPKKVVVEFRHPSWLTDETKQLLSHLGCIFCAADSPQIKPLDWVTADTAYLRLHGRKAWYDYNYTNSELRNIADFAMQLQQNGAKKIYIFFNNDYHGYAANNAFTLGQLLQN